MAIDFSLSDEQAMLRDTARNFAKNEIEPVAREIHDEDVAHPWQRVRPMFEEATELGFTTMLVPEEYGGEGGDLVDHVLLMEEFGATDIGIALSYFNNTITSTKIISEGGTESQREQWLNELTSLDAPLLTGAQNEPDVAGSNLHYRGDDPDIGLQTYAERDGDEYVINGNKAAFCTNAGISDYYFVVARTSLNEPAFRSTSVFFVPEDADGLEAGQRTELLGWKTAHHAEVRLDDVRVPTDALIGEAEGNIGEYFPRVMPALLTGFAACYIGLARRAYERAMDYAHQRESWGESIVNHQAVKLRLAEMYADVRKARLMVWDAAHAIETGDPEAPAKAYQAKTGAVDMAIQNAERAVKMLGGYGVAEDSTPAKLLEDAWTGWPVDGTREIMRMDMVDHLLRLRNEGPSSSP